MASGKKWDFVPPDKMSVSVMKEFWEHASKVAAPKNMARAESIHSSQGAALGRPMFSEDMLQISSSMEGSFGEEYEVVLDIPGGFSNSSCGCAFFQDNEGIACKHLLALAIWGKTEGMAQVQAAELKEKTLADARVPPKRNGL